MGYGVSNFILQLEFFERLHNPPDPNVGTHIRDVGMYLF